MTTIDPTSLSFGQLREVLSALETAERDVGRFSPAVRETIVDRFLSAAIDRGIDVAEFPRLTGRQPVAEIRDTRSTIPPTETSKGKMGGGHPFKRGSGAKTSSGAGTRAGGDGSRALRRGAAS